MFGNSLKSSIFDKYMNGIKKQSVMTLNHGVEGSSPSGPTKIPAWLSSEIIILFIFCKFNKFNGRSIMDDHRHPSSFSGRVW
jgi:hypothetical protein